MSSSEKGSSLPIGAIIRENTLLRDRARAKTLGQNFLTDPTILRRIVQAAGSLEEQAVLEIGPGPGGLTREILRGRPARFVAVEKDPHCVEALTPLASQYPEWTLVEGDMLTLDLEQVWSLSGGKRWHIIANLPYNVGTEILIRLLQEIGHLEGLTLMFQKEVADRLVASRGSSDYSRLSVLTQAFTRVRRVMTLPPGAFIPPPKVFSTVVHLTPRRETNLALWAPLDRVLRAAFQSKRKMIRHSLQAVWPGSALLDVLGCCGLRPESRPEDLSVDDFLHLAQCLQSQHE